MRIDALSRRRGFNVGGMLVLNDPPAEAQQVPGLRHVHLPHARLEVPRLLPGPALTRRLQVGMAVPRRRRIGGGGGTKCTGAVWMHRLTGALCQGMVCWYKAYMCGMNEQVQCVRVAGLRDCGPAGVRARPAGRTGRAQCRRRSPACGPVSPRADPPRCRGAR